MPALLEFQERFCAELFDPALSVSSGMAVYRNTVMKGLVDTLAANYPTVARLVGTEWFEAAAAVHAREHLPEHPALCLYGERFAAFLASFEPAADLPYLSEVARLDRAWTEAHFSADSRPLPNEGLATVPSDRLRFLRLRLHPAARVLWCEHSAVTIWRHNRPPAVPPECLETDALPEGAVLVRPRGSVDALVLGRAGYQFLCDIQRGDEIGKAALSALAVDSTLDMAGLLARLIRAGTFLDTLEFTNDNDKS